MHKIVHLTTVHPADDVRIYQKQCLSLHKLGYQVSLIGPAPINHVQHDVTIHAIKPNQSRYYRMSVQLWHVYRAALKQNASIYHFHDPELILVGLLLRLHGKKVIYDVHEDVPRDILLKNWIWRPLRKFVAKIVEKIEFFASGIFSAIVTVTPLIQQRFAHTNAVEVRNYPVINEFLQIRRSETSSLCYAGLITEARGFHEMLAATNLTNSTINMAGRIITENLKTEIASTVNVNYVGQVDRLALAKLYESSLIGLALLHPGPTFNDSLPIKIFEYMAAGMPVIASDFPLWRDIIEAHQCGFCVNPLDVTEICDKINYLKNNMDKAIEMGQRGREAVIALYNWDAEFKKLANLYQRLMS